MLDVATLLDRAPNGLRRFAYRMAAGQGVFGQLADAIRFRFSQDEVPDLPNPSSEPVRVLIGPTNSAGQAYRWARAFQQHLPGVAAISLQGTAASPFLPEVDVRVPVAVYQRSAVWHAALEEYLSSQTHVVWESGLPLLGRKFGSDVARELAYFLERGVQGALMFHGSDIRSPSRHAAQNRWSPFRDPSGPVRALEEGAARNAALATESRVPVFVSTPDLLQWLPNATWCPVVVDAVRWSSAATTGRRNGPPVVAHAPSQKWLKGTGLIEPMLHRLAEEGVIEYRQIVAVPHAAMPDFYAHSDIVLDQFVLGSYGVSACEALASGRLVVGHIDDVTRATVREQTGSELPVHEATIDSLESELRQIAADRDMLEAARSTGPAFVERVHTGPRSAAAAAPFLSLS